MRTTPDHAADEKASISGLAAWRPIVRSPLSSDTLITRQVSAWQRGLPSGAAFPRSILDPLLLGFPLHPFSSRFPSHPMQFSSTSHPLLSTASLYSTLSHSCPGSSLTVYLPTPPNTPLLIPSVRTLGPSSVRRSIGILHPVSLPTCPRRKRTKVLSLLWCSQRFLFYARASTHRLLYTSFCEFYVGRVKTCGHVWASGFLVKRLANVPENRGLVVIGLIKLGLRVGFFFIERNENIDSDRYNIVDGILNFVVLEFGRVSNE